MDDSIRACVDEVLRSAGRIDVLVNNAGYSSYGAIEDVPLEEGRRQFDVKPLWHGAAHSACDPCHAGAALWKNRQHFFYGRQDLDEVGGWYHATKYAVEGLSDCLRMELRPFGIDVIVVEPGGIKTDWGIIAANNLKRLRRAVRMLKWQTRPQTV